MTFTQIFRFELGCQARSATTYLYFAVLLTASFFLSLELSSDYAVADGSLANSPFLITALSLLWSTLGLLVAAAVAGESAARDAQTRMDPLVYSAPLGKMSYLGGRFLAAFVLYAIVVLSVPLGLLLGEVLRRQSEIVGPFRPDSYVRTYVFFLVPNAFFVTAISFSMAALARRAAVAYLGALLLIGASAFNWTIVAGTWGRWDLAKLLDPLGVVVLGELSMAWTPTERNTQAIGLEGVLLWNRILWGGVAAAALGLLFRVFRFRHPARPSWRTRFQRSASEAALPPRGPIILGPTVFSTATHAAQMLAIARASFSAIVAGWGSVILVATAAFLAFSAMPAAHMGVPMVPTAERVLRFLAAPLATPQEINGIVVPLLILFWAGELIWRERDARLNDIADVTPTPDWVLFFGKLSGLWLVLGGLQTLVMAGGILTQVVLGNLQIQLALYLQTLFGLQLADYLLFSLLAFFLHTAVNHKFVGHLSGVVAYAFMAFAPALGVEHNLLVYGADPGWSYSDIRRFEPFLGAWLWFKFYWGTWALLLANAGMLFWVRGRQTNLRTRMSLARGRFTPPVQGAAAAALALIVAVGCFIFYNTNILNAYASGDDGAVARADYERKFGQFRNVVQPEIARVSLNVEIYPQRRQVEIRGTYDLTNQSTSAINTIHLATKSAVETIDIRFDHPATELVADTRLGHRAYRLVTAIRPGDSLRLTFKVRFQPRGFSNRRQDASVAPNGTYFTNAEWLPSIGYQPDRELQNMTVRRAAGLPGRPMMPGLDNDEARFDPERTARLAFEAVIGTDSGQVAVAPGRLRRSWIDKDRRYFHYVTDAPIRNDYEFFSAEYSRREAFWRPPSGNGPDVLIEVFHHPAHALNVDRMIRGVRAALDYYTRILGPYPHGQLRLVEHAGDELVLHSAPVNISYTEPFGLLMPDEDPRNIDLLFAVVAHEVAHQWWGNALTPAGVEGAGFLTESLAWYSALGVVEHALGPAHLDRLLGMMREVYLRPASRANVPLLRTDDAFLAYRKGPFVMFALREYVGANRIDDVLRRFLDQHKSGEPPLPTSLDLYREFQAVTPKTLHPLLADLFEKNTFWELSTNNVAAKPIDSGRWQVTLEVQARKVVVDENGTESEVPMDDLIEIGVFADAPGSATSATLYREKHRVRSGRQRLTVNVASRPDRAGIGPRHLLIEVKGEDNLRAIHRQTAKLTK